MKNEFGEKLDRNGYAPSILQFDNNCAVCFSSYATQRHEVFHGSNRSRSKELGLWLNLCPICHYKVHNGDGSLDRKLKANAQTAAMIHYGWTTEEFRRRFGKSYV